MEHFDLANDASEALKMIISVLLWLLSHGPTLLLWAAILFFPARMIWKRLRPRFRQEAVGDLSCCRSAQP